MNVLITGSTGFFGKHIAKVFNDNCCNVYGVSRSFSNSLTNQRILDINDHYKLNEFVSEKSIDIIIHVAGKPIVFDCEKNPYDAYKVNGLGTASVLEVARKNKVKRVLSVETDKVYGCQEENVPTDETATLNPNSPYEFSKFLAANFAEYYRNHYNLEVISIRPANLFGPFDFSTSRIIPRALSNLKVGKGIRLYDTALEMRRDFVYVKDAAKAMYILTTNDLNHTIYNISNNVPMSMKEMSDRILKALDLKIPHDIVKKEVNYKEIPFQSIDGSRFKKEFDFEFTPFEDAIRETWRLLNT